jgi:pyruvate dehydrogenase E2 component (dihydrolipoamide acetyltransferase)
MAIVIDMPKLSDTMEEGVIAKWNIKEGDEVSSGDIIAEVETDKATMDVEVFDAGTVLKIMADEGEAIPLGGKIAIIGEEGEDISDLLGDDDTDASDKSESNSGSDEKKDEQADKKSESKEDFDDPILGDLDKDKKQKAESSDDDESRIKASPLARKMAEEKRIKLSDVSGSGPNGRIVKADIESYEPSTSAESKTSVDVSKAPSAPMPEGEAYEDVRISQMRKTIAKRLAESKFTNPHFYETVDIDMSNAIEARGKLNEISDVKISYNDFVVKACAVALRKHPNVNVSWLGDVIRKHHRVHVAVAVAVDEGLLTPVIKNTDTKGLMQISKETKEMAGRAREKKLQPEEMEGSTFSISNLGMFGIEDFTAIINPPNAAILAVGAIRDVPVVKDGEVVPGKRMKVTLSSDHRVVDGATSAEFLNTVKDLLENPMGMLL